MYSTIFINSQAIQGLSRFPVIRDFVVDSPWANSGRLTANPPTDMFTEVIIDTAGSFVVVFLREGYGNIFVTYFLFIFCFLIYGLPH